MTVAEFATALQQYCLMTGGSVTSYGRTAKRNREVGGVEYSAHRFWRGADVVYDSPIDEGVAKVTASRLDLLVIREDDHDHLQPLEWLKG